MARTSVYPGPPQHARDHGLGAATAPACRMGVAMTADPNVTLADARRDYLLAEFRCALIKAKLAQLDIEAVALALKYDIVAPEQALAMFWDSEAVRFLGLELGEVSR